MNKGTLICLYGTSGSGKTRLLQTMENSLSGEGVLRAGVEAIVWELVDSLRYARAGSERNGQSGWKTGNTL